MRSVKLAPIGAEIVEVPASNEDEFIEVAHDADAIIAKGVRISKYIIDSLKQCKVIALGSVGADSVDVAAATTRPTCATGRGRTPTSSWPLREPSA